MTIITMLRFTTIGVGVLFITTVLSVGWAVHQWATITQYQEALEFYAAPEMWEAQGIVHAFGTEHISPALYDMGLIARNALGDNDEE